MSHKENIIAYNNGVQQLHYLNLDSVLLIQPSEARRSDGVITTIVKLYMLKGIDRRGEYKILEVNEFDQVNYKKIKNYLAIDRH
jgi:hypothetical protein